MMTFRQRVFVGQGILLVVFLVLLAPLISHSVRLLTQRDLQRQLAMTIAPATSLNQLVDLLEDRQPSIAVYDATGTELQHRGDFPQVDLQPLIQQAMSQGRAYQQIHNPLLGQEFGFYAQRTSIAGVSYVAVEAMSLDEQQQILLGLEMDLITWCAIILIIFMVSTWLVLYVQSRPIKNIIEAVRPFQEGLVDQLPVIAIPSARDDFSRLGQTLNSLSQRIRTQIGALKEERDDKEAILASLLEGVIAVDNQLHITYANPAAATMLGQDNLIGQRLDRAKYPRYVDLLETARTQQRTVSDTIHFEERQRRVFDILATPLADGRGAVLILQDKSSHYRLLDQGKEFVANASHELKTPITIIRGFAETLHDHPELPPEKSREITEKIVRNCERMDRMIRNLLTLADVERLPLTRLQECNLLDVTEQCVSLISDIYPDAQITIHTQPNEDYTLIAEPALLTHAINNLLDNAAKYSNRPAHITITLQRTPHTILLSVADKGIGIAREELDKIFQRFYTVSRQRSQILGGSGLGLSIVQTIIDKHLGTIRVDSVPGLGTTFTIELPTRLEEADREERG